jgi:hypothetical protein
VGEDEAPDTGEGRETPRLASRHVAVRGGQVLVGGEERRLADQQVPSRCTRPTSGPWTPSAPAEGVDAVPQRRERTA